MARNSQGTVRIAALGLVLLALAACATSVGNAALTAPKVSLEAIAIGTVRGGEAELTLTLRVENPNPVALVVNSLRFDATVNDLGLANGATSHGETIAAGGSALIDVEAHTDINAVLKLITMSASHRMASLEYSVAGEAVVQNGVRLPFARRGEIPLPAAGTPSMPAR